MTADVKLGTDMGDDFVVLEGTAVLSSAPAIMVDAPEYRSSADGYRRALVHHPGDALAINYDGDYPGGVSIRDVSLQAATINLRMMNQDPNSGMPRDGKPGDLLFVFTGPSMDGVALAHASLWICVPADPSSGLSSGPGAQWQEIPLGAVVEGTV